MRVGLACLTLAFAAGIVFDVSLPIKGGRFDLNYNSSDGMPSALVYLASIFGFGLIAIGLIWELFRYKSERHDASRKKVIAIEARGLRDTSGTPLVSAVPEELEGRREQILLDVRQRIRDGTITDPDAAIRDLTSLPDDIRRRENGIDRRDITYVYGGLTPVPLTFLTGTLVDDEGKIVIMDWDRHSGNWRLLSEADDLKRFAVSGIAAVPLDSPAVAIMIEVSYRINIEDVRQRAGTMPIVHLTLADGSPDCHWSELKQQALGQQFLDTLVLINNRGVKRVYLFLAAQNSIVFRFGRLYDRRNLPEVIVYQYERGQDPVYAWGIKMPVNGVSAAEVMM